MASTPAPDKAPTHTKPAAGQPSAGSAVAAPDWERIELDFRAGILSLREIAANQHVSHQAIAKRAKSAGWDRDLGAKIKARADALVDKALVDGVVDAGRVATERQVVDASAQAAASIRLSHRKDIHRKRAIVSRLMDELEAQVGPENAALLADLGEIMRAPDDSGQDKRNDLYRKIISLPERAKTAKTLAETLRMAVDMERQAFGMDAKDADKPQPGAAGYVPPSITVTHVHPPPRRPDDDDDEDISA